MNKNIKISKDLIFNLCFPTIRYHEIFHLLSLHTQEFFTKEFFTRGLQEKTGIENVTFSDIKLLQESYCFGLEVHFAEIFELMKELGAEYIQFDFDLIKKL